MFQLGIVPLACALYQLVTANEIAQIALCRLEWNAKGLCSLVELETHLLWQQRLEVRVKRLLLSFCEQYLYAAVLAEHELAERLAERKPQNLSFLTAVRSCQTGCLRMH